jgi:hypothetical protein
MEETVQTRKRIVAAALCAGAVLLAGRAPAEEAPRRTLEVCGHRLELMTAAEVRALGFPWTDVPEAENAAEHYLRGANALHELKAEPLWREQFEHAVQHGWGQELTALDATLDRAATALAHYRAGAALDRCQLPYAKSPMLAGMLLPSLSKARMAARLLAAEARRYEAKGEYDEAVGNYFVILRLGKHYGNGRTLVDHLVGTACVQVGLNAAFGGLYRHAYPTKKVREFLGKLDKERAGLPDYVHALRSERAFGLGTVDDLMRVGPGGLGLFRGVPAGLTGSESPLQQRLLRILLPDRTVKKDMGRFYDKHIAAAAKPYHEAPPGQDFLEETKPWNLAAHMLLPTLSRSRNVSVRCRALYDALRLALAIKLYQAETGVYPDKLQWLVDDKVVEALPVDPFSGEPFRYRVKDGQFVLYSVGANRKDDGGKVETRPGRAEDVGFNSKMPAAKAYKPLAPE